MKDRRGAVALEFIFVLAIELAVITAIIFAMSSQYNPCVESIFYNNLVTNIEKIGNAVDSIVSTGAVGEVRSITITHQKLPNVSKLSLIIENNTIAYSFVMGRRQISGPPFSYTPKQNIVLTGENMENVADFLLVTIKKDYKEGAVVVSISLEAIA